MQKYACKNLSRNDNKHPYICIHKISDCLDVVRDVYLQYYFSSLLLSQLFFFFTLVSITSYKIFFSATKVCIDDVLTCRAWKRDSVAKKKRLPL